ncbi:MAG: radical SAM protein [Desulfobacterales bacterium]|nr:radical SAM protein [Desulfobacterales bacterium]
MIEIHSFIPVTEAEGPGKRFAIWVQGCSVRCKGCCNPHLLKAGIGKNVMPDDLLQEILKVSGSIDGISLMGGEPFDQAQALTPFLKQVKKYNLSVVIFTGYTLDEIRKGHISGGKELLNYIDLLIDGPFISELATTSKQWVGSSNQQIHYLSNRFQNVSKSYANTVEIHVSDNEVVFNGFPINISPKELEKLGLIIK